MAFAALGHFAGGAHLGQLVLLGALQPCCLAACSQRRIPVQEADRLNPWADPTGAGWNIIQSLLAIGSGGLFGLGLGRSRQKFSYLPEHHTDFIFAILCEELGFVGGAMVVLLFFVLAWRAKDCSASTGHVRFAAGHRHHRYDCLSAMINMGVVTGSLPVTDPAAVYQPRWFVALTSLAGSGAAQHFPPVQELTEFRLFHHYLLPAYYVRYDVRYLRRVEVVMAKLLIEGGRRLNGTIRSAEPKLRAEAHGSGNLAMARHITDVPAIMMSAPWSALGAPGWHFCKATSCIYPSTGCTGDPQSA